MEPRFQPTLNLQQGFDNQANTVNDNVNLAHHDGSGNARIGPIEHAEFGLCSSFIITRCIQLLRNENAHYRSSENPDKPVAQKSALVD
ncbi:hypothetical protein [Serratia sp. AKBS12]|uniref:hypothetical protein n=1 Tax=Serratia sp. AKBS12 TaxID=2974597 RepID=UPI00216526F2|nr:hypothetical protein [Serratia sp. AKBS12]MCS3408735.1 hypothetical protein [Serratia sp. AKBS12]